jgi:hypothetical protein
MRPPDGICGLSANRTVGDYDGQMPPSPIVEQQSLFSAPTSVSRSLRNKTNKNMSMYLLNGSKRKFSEHPQTRSIELTRNNRNGHV